MASRILWEISSSILIIIGIMHLRGALFTTQLHPINKNVIEEMKISPIEFDTKALLWKAGIGFNATFSICLIFMGIINFYLAFKHFEIIHGFSFISIASMACTGLLSWIASRFLIKKVERIFLIVAVCFFISALLSI